MKKSINFSEFCDSFRSAERSDNFSYNGLKALYDNFEDYQDSTGEEIELDVIAICCDYTEYGSLEELKRNYNDIHSFEMLEEQTQVIYINGYQDEESSFIIHNY